MWLILVSVIIICLGVWTYRNSTYWERKGIKHIKPWTLLGSFGRNTFRQVTFVDQLQYLYNYHPDEKFVGAHQFTQPAVLIRDPDLVKQVCVKSFDNFMNHTVFFTEDIDPLFGKNLFSLEGQRWRNMRATLSPAFTSSKMRGMHLLIKDCAIQFCEYFRKQTEDNNCVFEMKDVFTKYTNDVIATTAFGITVDSLKDEHNAFYKAGKQISNFGGVLTSLKFVMLALLPSVSKALRINLFSEEISDFFRGIVKSTIEYREKNNVIRPDMIHLLMEARKGRLKHEKAQDDDTGFATVQESNIGTQTSEQPPLTIDDITAQAILFFLGGYDSSSTLMCFLAHELAVHVDIQKQLQTEIDIHFQKDIDYETILKMKYLDMVVSECLRLWPPGPLTERICTENFTFDDGHKSVTVEKGQSIWVPVYAFHRDPKHFPNPDKFDPERFNDQNKLDIKPFTYMPFGQGPRNCIGSRFALLEVKTLFVYLLRSFDLVVVEKTQIPLRLSKSPFSMRAEKGFWLGLKPRH